MSRADSRVDRLMGTMILCVSVYVTIILNDVDI
jgi:hypothetical protein